MASTLHQKLGGQVFAEYGYAAALVEQRRIASREPADWFIAHAHAALPIAAASAKRWQAWLGFDCEDLLAERQTDPVAIIRSIEKNYLARCDYVSTPSQSIADSLQREYEIKPPVVLYNVFPLSLATGMLPPRQRVSNGPMKLHWFSQTIGPGRGIEDAISACGMLKDEVELHLRGMLSPGYADKLLGMCASKNINVKLHPQIDHDHLIRSMDQFDVGLALEREQNIGAALTVSNKIGSYLMAGLAIAATDTPGQREVLDQIPAAGFLYPSGKPEQLAHGLKAWISDRNLLLAAQEACWEAARAKWNWEVEARKLFSVLA
jgi:glycosyltransferase involved in cell wall biosynthesis